MSLVKKGLNTAPVAEEAVVEDESSQVENVLTEGKTKKKDAAKAAYYEALKKDGIEQLKKDTEAKVALGAKSDKVSYLHALGNPAKEGTRTEKGKKGIPTIEVVGYKLRAEADIQVPVIDRTNLPKCDVMGANTVTWVPVKKGQEFIISRGELGEMITLEEYNGTFTGDAENIVELQITISKAAGNTYAPLTILKKSTIGNEGAPIKAHIVPIANRKPGTNGKSISDFEVLPEYAEKFGYIFAEVKSEGRAPRTYEKRNQGQSAAELAAAMRAYKKRTNA